MKKLTLALTTSVLLALSPSTVKANFFNFTYTGDGISASGILTTSGGLINDIDGSGQNGYDITGISGMRNGVPISGLVPNPDFPGDTVYGGVIYDNALLTDPFGLDNNGLSFDVAADEYNVFSQDNPTGGGYYEAANGTFDYIPVDLTITAAVPETSNTLASLGFGCLALVGIRRRQSACFGDRSPAS